MYKKITENEFIALTSEEQYRNLAMEAFAVMKEAPEFKNNRPYVYSLMAIPCVIYGVGHHLVIEADAHKILHNTGILNAYDFGIIGLALTDDPMSDELLDKYNAIKKTKEAEK